MFWKSVPLFALVLAIGAAPAWSQAQTPDDVEHLEEMPVFTAETVARTTKAVNFRYRRGDTKVDFGGTALSPIMKGEAKVQAKKGAVVVEAEFSGIKAANEFGAEYLTYVLWAVSPQGRATNLGELLADDYGRAKLKATTELQAFGMVVTAEPYFTVRRPSDLIVAEMEVREDTRGEVLPVEAKYELLKRGEYAELANPLALSLDLKRNPIDLYQARNAVQIARSLQAENYAGETFGKAVESLERAEDLAKRRASKKDIATLARQAAQTAEDARELSEKRMEQERLENERLAAAEREANARAQAEEASRLRAEAEMQSQKDAALREQAVQAKTAAERQRLEAQVAAAEARAEMEKALREKEQAQRMIAQAQSEALTARQQQEAAAAAISRMGSEREQLAIAKTQAEEAAATATREKQGLAEMIARTRAEADQAKQERGEALTTAESLRLEREELAAQKAEADHTAAEAVAAAAEAQQLMTQAREELEQARAEKDAALAAKTEADQLMAQARTDLEQARREQEAALAAKAGAEQSARAARDEAQQLAKLRARAEDEAKRAARERDEMRDRMQSALSKVVETQETSRGLILNLPDILFDFGKSTLRPEAREVLSRIAGIMMVTPGYRLLIEGHTDSVGSDEINQKLSEQRAGSVYEYLGESKVASGTMATAGFGKTKPIASNDTTEGRQKNRRVEIVIQDDTQPPAGE